MTPGFKYYRVSPAIWREPWDDDTKLVAFYLLTCEHRTTEGLFRMPLTYAQSDMGWPAKRFDRAFNQLLAAGFIEHDEDAEVVLIVNALRYQAPANPKQAIGAVNQLKGLPRNRLADRFETIARTVSSRLAEALDKAFPEGFAKRYGNTPSPSPSPLKPVATPTETGSDQLGHSGRAA